MTALAGLAAALLLSQAAAQTQPGPPGRFQCRSHGQWACGEGPESVCIDRVRAAARIWTFDLRARTFVSPDASGRIESVGAVEAGGRRTLLLSNGGRALLARDGGRSFVTFGRARTYEMTCDPDLAGL